MRGRRRNSPDKSVSQDQARMALRKQVLKDAGDVPSRSHQIDDDTEEDEALEDDNDEFSSSLLSPSSSRGTRRRERENKSKPKEMTEEEMMDLALRLSEQEASITALRLQKEEEAMMKAIHESMTQPCSPSQSQSLLSDPEASLRISSRRKLLYSNGQPASEDGCTAEKDLNRGAKRSGDGGCSWNKKRKRKEGSPLLEMPDLSQTQKINSQASTCSSEVLELHLDSQQSTDSTQIDDCHPCKSPVFPLTGLRAEVHVPRLTQDLLQNCRTSGFVLCSLDSSTSPPKSSSAQPKSPTFPKSPERSDNLMTVPKSPVFSETDQDGGAETQPSPEYFKSPVFGSNTQNKKSSSASKPQVSVCNSGFMFSSQESLTSSVRSTSCRPKSPVFPRSPDVTPERPAASRSPVFSETDPVFGQSGRRQKIRLDEQKHSANPSAAELRASVCGGNSATTGRRRQDGETDRNQRVGLNASCKSDDVEEELKEISKERESAELTSDMTLLLSDEDDVTPVGSPSPVFPEERPVLHVAAASPGTSGSTCRPSTYTTEREQQPISSQGAVSSVSAPPGQPAGGSTVHYYWGVPFCPRGLDPDSYTKVILAQMDVYEKSLKQAQRCLLRKAEWGEAILPQPEKSPSPEPRAESPQELFPRRRGFRLRSKKLCDAAEEATEEDEGNNKEDEDKQEIENKDEEKKNEGGGGEVDSDDCEVCPETQLSDNDDDRTQDLMIDTDAGSELRQKSPEPPEVEMIVQDDSPAVQELQDEEMEVEVEVDAPADRKTKGNIPVRSSDVGGDVGNVEEDGEDPDVEEIKDRGLQRSSSPELDPAVVPRSPETSVDCPICQGSFPVTEIEMHAAYCDGDVDERRPKADCFQVTSKPRRKRTRRADLTAEEANEPPNAVRNPEKCFICQKAVPVRDYSRHTELCIQQQRTKSAAKGNLLSALEKTDSRDSEAGPSGSKPPPSDVIDLRDDDDDEEEEGSASAFRVSNSPIRAFTPISEAAGCLIDFKKQHRTKKLSQRRR
ncbi:uncharacterized protein uimc1 isoform X1 [Acanthopagrus latus]|uniref:uncharacterized protein uimc1 isoform X1 n=1 Tax=Acanthopagrus latus TaxID=8177 RepID=UPI00187C2C25|nr:uncharacterized protein uimc1 isoform X1 [Acanthopagrus latus]XP_036974950.1 uncharacterized protein uimc1 isoform X1 [Acanthopagrus latus]